jgi:hypothetical protein
MPITPAYSWSESAETVQIVVEGVPVRDQSAIFCSDRLIKLNTPPYLLLLDLKHEVDDGASSATLLRGRGIVFNLIKVRHGTLDLLLKLS